MTFQLENIPNKLAFIPVGAKLTTILRRLLQRARFLLVLAESPYMFQKTWEYKNRFGWSLTLLIFASSVAVPLAAQANPVTFSYHGAETADDKRENYNIDLLKLALEKTKAKYGDYRLQAIPPMNAARALYATKVNTYPNLVLAMGYDDKRVTEDKLAYINFPIDLGISNYHICFVRPDLKPETDKIRSVENLLRYTFGQELTSTDAMIFRSQHFKITEISNYKNLFTAVAIGKVDFVCRDVNDIFDEFNTFKSILGLTYDINFTIKYTEPKLFFLNSLNGEAKTRIEDGLKIAYSDGSLKKLWQTYFQNTLAAANLKKRVTITIENTLIKNLSTDYEAYFLEPTKIN